MWRSPPSRPITRSQTRQAREELLNNDGPSASNGATTNNGATLTNNGATVRKATISTGTVPVQSNHQSLIDLDGPVVFNCKACDQPDNPQMIPCSNCNDRYHLICTEANDLDQEWQCATCSPNNNVDRNAIDAELSFRQLDLLDEQSKLMEQQSRLIEEKLKILNNLRSSFHGRQPKHAQVHSHGSETGDDYQPPDISGQGYQQHQYAPSSQAVAPEPIAAGYTNQFNNQAEPAPVSSTPSRRNQPDSVQQFDTQIQQMIIRQSTPKLPTFSGRPEEWPAFIAAFTQTTRMCKYDNTENLLRLQESLKGRARDAVESQLSLPDCVPEIIKTLEAIFGRPDLLINAQIEKVRAYPAIRNDKLESIVTFSFLINNLVATIKAANIQVHLNNPMLIQAIVSKLPTGLQLKWASTKRINATQITLEGELSVLASLLNTMASDAASVMQTPLVGTNQNKSSARVNVHDGQQTNYESQDQRTCLICSKDCTNIVKCEEFLKKSISERWAEIKEKRICKVCLKRHGPKCYKWKQCEITGCDKYHHRLLHFKTESTGTTKIQSDDPSRTNYDHQEKDKAITTKVQNTGQPETSCSHQGGEKTLFRIIPVIIANGPKEVQCFAFLDEGSSVTLIEKGLANEIELDGENSPLLLKWTGNESRSETDSVKATIRISGLNKNKKYRIPVRTVNSLNLPTQSIDYDQMCLHEPCLKRLPIVSYRNASPRILIGINNQDLTVPIKTRHGENSHLLATKCKLGWTISGCTRKESIEQTQYMNVHATQHDENLNELFREFLSIDSMGINKNPLDLLSNDERKALETMKDITKKVGDHYETGLLWKDTKAEIPNSYQMALNRLKNLESRLKKDIQLKDACNEQLRMYLDKGYIRKLTPEELSVERNRIWYLPIFPVINKNKPGKVRLVWDAAATVNGISLNSLLMTGPDITASLLSVLMSFRERKIALSGDIEQMYHRVAINKEDQHAQRFLWRNCDTSRDPDVYIMQVMTFGATCSPFQAQFVKNSNAQDFGVEFAQAIKAIVFHTYVDDTLISVDTEHDAVQVANQMKQINAAGNFNIRNWHSNSVDVLRALGESSTDTTVNMNKSNQNDTEKVLGMWWVTTDDVLTYSLKFNTTYHDLASGLRPPTKREILKIMMSVYDPLGLIAHFLVSLKILLKEIWQSATDWDEPISSEPLAKWYEWTQNLKDIEQLKIPRCYLGTIPSYDGTTNTIHIFTDAGQEAMAATAYLRIQKGEKIQVSIVAAKTKISPTKPMSIPRLELQAALIGSRLYLQIKSALTIEIHDTTFWCDSSTVVAWIRNCNSRLTQFVAFRVGEIRSSTNINSWRLIPSEDNVADEGTKYTNTPKLLSNSRWFQGPSFLYEPESNWPGQHEVLDDEVNVLLHHHDKPLIDVTRFSKWFKLLRTTAYVTRFINRRKPNYPSYRSRFLQQFELAQAQNILIRQAQQEFYALDYAKLLKGKTIDEESILYRLSPYVDESGVLRIKGRIDNCMEAEFKTKRPIILPPDHHITKLIIMNEHERHNHHFNETVVNNLRQTYYIQSIRIVVNSVTKGCQICKNNKATPQIPEMARLPAARLSSYSLPFTHTGVDYFGPYLISIGRRTEKRWGVIYTCLTTRAIHIELTDALTTDACIRSMRNFMCRRGTPNAIYCDRGTNFIGSEKELRESLKLIDPELIANKFMSAEIKWYFNPPDAPHMGGAWERLIRSIKNCLEPKLPNRYPTHCELESYLIEVEHIINSRPYTYLPLDTEEDCALTPNDIILSTSTGCKPMGPLDDSAFMLKKSWHAVQYLSQKFWKRWTMEYLPDLTKRTKWYDQNTTNLAVDDVVIVIDGKLPRNAWPKGRIVNVTKSSDGKVRRATVKTSTGIYERPVTKLARLDVVSKEVESQGLPTGGAVRTGPAVVNINKE